MARKLTSIIAIILLLAAFSVFVAGCVRQPEICNYDKVCDDVETDNCIDCVDVLGRNVDVLVKTDNEIKVVGGP